MWKMLILSKDCLGSFMNCEWHMLVIDVVVFPLTISLQT